MHRSATTPVPSTTMINDNHARLRARTATRTTWCALPRPAGRPNKTVLMDALGNGVWLGMTHGSLMRGLRACLVHRDSQQRRSMTALGVFASGTQGRARLLPCPIPRAWLGVNDSECLAGPNFTDKRVCVCVYIYIYIYHTDININTQYIYIYIYTHT